MNICVFRFKLFDSEVLFMYVKMNVKCLFFFVKRLCLSIMYLFKFIRIKLYIFLKKILVI